MKVNSEVQFERTRRHERISGKWNEKIITSYLKVYSTRFKNVPRINLDAYKYTEASHISTYCFIPSLEFYLFDSSVLF